MAQVLRRPEQIPTAQIGHLTTTAAHPLKSQTETMLACEWHGAEDMRVVPRGKPLITDPKDCIIKVTSTTICGSDLHMYFNKVPGDGAMQPGDVMGHESMGIVESVGPEVKNLKPGDRVVVSAVISCGNCFYCKKGDYSCCDTTNPSEQCEKMYGQRISGIFGYTHLTGAYDGGQAEFVRVPIADVNCLKVPNALSDEQVLFLSDIVCTGWHGCEMADVSQGETVAVWGCGPVGLCAMMWCRFRGVKDLIAIDHCPYRIETAKKLFNARTINFDQSDVVQTLKQLYPNGVDACIDCAGFRFPISDLHKKETAAGRETDALDIINEMVIACRKSGKIGLIGDYFGYGNHFPIGAMMEKGINMRGSQVFVQKYWRQLLGYIQEGKVNPTFLVTHTMPLDKAAEAYHKFAYQKDNVIKVVLKPKGSLSR
jgi:threonine dehydrogenase-like Zn-dependent dehydrogenase